MTGAETYKDLRGRIPEGYGGIGTTLPPPAEIPTADELLALLKDRGFPILKEASGDGAGPFGVLRALDLPGKQDGILKDLALSGREVLVILFRPVGPCGALHWWRVKLVPRRF